MTDPSCSRRERMRAPCSSFMAAVTATVVAACGGTTSGPEAGTEAGPDTNIKRVTGGETMSGTHEFDAIFVEPGATVTASGDLTLVGRDSIVIEGTVTGDCVALTAETPGPLRIRGRVSNACGELPEEEDPPELRLVGEEGWSVVDAEVTSSGHIVVTDDPDFTVDDLPELPRLVLPRVASSRVSAAPSAQAAAQEERCEILRGELIEEPRKARSGREGTPDGTNGKSGSHIIIGCSEPLGVAGALLTAQSGGDGGEGIDTDKVAAEATGGLPGSAGAVVIVAPAVVLLGDLDARAGDGGNGGDATATGEQGRESGIIAASAEALARSGTRGGIVLTISNSFFAAPSEVRGDGSIRATIGKGGNGGIAIATAAHGLNATETERAQQGGEATARGGHGGSFEGLNEDLGELRLPPNVELRGGNGGDALGARAQAGNGGNGSRAFKQAAEAGDGHAFGGHGGDGLAPSGGRGGNGGTINFDRGKGGDGWSDCKEGDIQAGGSGNDGADAFGEEGAGGDGSPAGDPGGVTFTEFGNGGDGGDGEPPGSRGFRGVDATKRKGGPTKVTEPSFEDGDDGDRCPTGDEVGILPGDYTGQLVALEDADPPHDPHVFDAGSGKPAKVRVSVDDDLLTIEGPEGFDPSPLPRLEGVVEDDGSFTISGAGPIAGVDGVLVVANGTLPGDGTITMKIEVGGSGKLPGGETVLYGFEGSRD